MPVSGAAHSATNVSGDWRRAAISAAEASSRTASLASLTEVVAAVKSTDFLVLRAKCRLAADDPVTALHWASIAIAVCTDSHQTNHMVLGKLHYLRGRCFQVLCVGEPIGAQTALRLCGCMYLQRLGIKNRGQC